MRVEYINPFIASLSNAFRTMLDCEVKRVAVFLKDSKSPKYDPPHEVSGVIGLSGTAVGTVVLSLSRNVALQAASVMLAYQVEEINADVIDAVGELTNMVAGAAKAQLEQHKLMVSLPSVIVGKGHEVRFPSDVTPICVQFQTPWGPLALEVGLTHVRSELPTACVS